jgi:hypothetical protein
MSIYVDKLLAQLRDDFVVKDFGTISYFLTLRFIIILKALF